MDLLLVISLTSVIFEQALLSSPSRFSTWGKHITFDELTCVRTVFMLFMRTSENPLSVSKANTIILPDLKVIATGGLSELVHEVNDSLFDIMDRELSLEGLNILYHLNSGGA